MVEPALSAPIADISRSGLVRPRADGKATLTLRLAGKSVEVPVTVLGVNASPKVDFVHDVAPVLSRLGCNAGTCHGSAQGKNGFKLSLRGYDPIFDVRALTDDLAARRVNLASPDDSLMLLKPTGAAPHVGGALMQPGEPYYEMLRAWIADGAKLDLTGAQGREDRGRAGQPGGPADRRPAADPRAGDLHQRRGPRRHPRGVPRQRQHRGRRGRPIRG